MHNIITKEKSIVQVALVGSDSLFRARVSTLLSEVSYEIVAESAKFSSVLFDDLSPEEDSSLVLIIESSGCEKETVVEICQAKASNQLAKILVLAKDPTHDHLMNCLGAGAVAYLLPDASIEIVTDTISLILDGQSVFPTKLAF
jgi:DNA-binding NarL/FixJ family response regulator